MKIIDEIIKDSIHSVGIVGHQNPDGDCVGSVMGLFYYFQDNFPNLTVTPYLESVSSNLQFLTMDTKVNYGSGENTSFDLVISLDCADLDRIGAGSSAFHNAKSTVCIDHHYSNQGFAQTNLILGDMSSTCEILCTLMDISKIGKETAICLYTGIAHDTGVFQYESVTGDTLRRAADLVEKGIPFPSILRHSMFEKSYAQLKLTSEVVANSVFYEEDGYVAATADLKLIEKYGLNPSALGSVVSRLQIIRGAEVVLFLYEKEQGQWKGSLRSKKTVNVADIAAVYGGGGHVRASGFSTQDSPDSVIQLVLQKVKEQLK